MKRFLVLMLLLIIPTIFSACAADKTSEKKAELHVGACMIFPPFEFIGDRDRKAQGFDIDVMEAIGRELGYDVIFHDMRYDDLLNSLERRNVDVVISALVIDDEKKAMVSFTKPYYETGIVVATLKDNENIKKFADLPGKRVGVVAGSSSAIEIREQRSIETVDFREINEAFNALAEGKIDAVVNDKPVIDYYINNHSGAKIKILDDVYKKKYYGIAVRKDEERFLSKIDDALQKVKDKGVYNRIYIKWFGEKR